MTTTGWNNQRTTFALKPKGLSSLRTPAGTCSCITSLSTNQRSLVFCEDALQQVGAHPSQTAHKSHATQQTCNEVHPGDRLCAAFFLSVGPSLVFCCQGALHHAVGAEQPECHARVVFAPYAFLCSTRNIVFNALEFLHLICRCGEIDSKVGRVDAGFFLLCVILASPLQKRP